MPIQIHGLDSRKKLFTKSFRGIDFTVAGVAGNASDIVFLPPKDTAWLVKAIYAYNREVSGTITDAPNISLDNGVDSGTVNIVAAVDLATTQGTAKIFTLANPATVIDNDHPLRVKMNDGADGSVDFRVDLIVELVELAPL